MSNDLLQSIIILVQNERGDKEILMRILNELGNNKKPFGADISYLEKIMKKYQPEDKHLLNSLE